MDQDPVSASWASIRHAAIVAVEASLRALVRHRRGDMLAHEPVALPLKGRALEVWTTLDRRWDDHEFYVVDADRGDERPDDRHRVELRRVEGKKLQFRVPAAARTGLAGTRQVRVFCVSDFEIELNRALRERLSEATRGDLVAQLWSGGSVEAEASSKPQLSPDGSLNAEQQHALAAMTRPGGVFVWGPPGTGKTKVITAAVRRAVHNGWSVLIASHANVAVDNVLENLVAPPDPTGFVKPGTVIRVAGSEKEKKVSPAVFRHEFLLAEKAAAVLTNHTVRYAELARRRQENREHPARIALANHIQATAGIDVDEVRAARGAVAAAARIESLARSLSELEAELAAALRRAAELAQLADAQRELARAEVAEAEASEERLALRLERQAVEARATQLKRRTWPWARRRRRRQAAELHAQGFELDAALLRAERRGRNADDELRCWRDRFAAAEAALRSPGSAPPSAEPGDIASEEERVERLRAVISSLKERIEDLRTTADVPGAEAVVTEARRRGLLQLLDEQDRLNALVATLDAEARHIERDEATLRDELSREYRRLVSDAPVIACTLAGLTLSRPLAKRRFDLVIIDEVSSAGPPFVVYAASRADRTLALVGDFLQNAPIAPELEEPVAGEDAQVVAWHEQDVFNLAGICSRRTAEAHPRCVPLTVQYRFPSVIADVVNRFCYDGMLESALVSTPGDGRIITMVDIGRHPDKCLLRAGDSWHSPLGLDLLAIIAASPGSEAGSVGFVCPYREQAERSDRRMRDEGLSVECGTSHRFQGRQFDTVILDLMQDGTPRWVAAADLFGPRRAVSAAKLLNVAITRARRRLYLIGDWDFVRRHRSPGMSAIAALEGHPNFEVVDATQFL